MERISRIAGIIGAVIWTGAVLLRGTAIMNIGVIAEILWRAPNFGAVWVANGLLFNLWPLFRKRKFDIENINLWLSSLLAAILLFEVVYGQLQGVGFDLWDVFASLVATAILILCKRLSIIYEW